MKIYIGADHAGFELKEKLIPYLTSLGYEVEDKGAHEYNKDDDYPDFVRPVAVNVSENKGSLGIILGKSGEGEAILANRIEGVRATVWYGGDKEILKLSRAHNDANVLSLGAGFIPDEEASEAVRIWLNTPFSEEERHIRRLSKFR